MKVLPKVSLHVIALALGLCLVACSSDSSSNLTGPTDSLDRSARDLLDTPITPALRGCELRANDIFGVGGMPFELSCENPLAANHVVLSETYNENNCMIAVEGEVEFTDTGNTYSYRAVTSGCPHDGGSLSVCGPALRGCKHFSLPRLYIFERDVSGTSPK